MGRIVAAALAVLLAGNGLAMLFAGLWWYGVVPGVAATGPYNPHFVRDIGAAYLVTGLSAAWFAWKPREGGPALVAGTLFLVLHSAIHVFDAACGTKPLADVMRDFAGVYLPTLLALAIVARKPAERSHQMLKAILTRWIFGMERQWNYDASYLHDVVRASPASLIKFMLGSRAPNSSAAPPEALFAAQLAGVLAEDCGPCTQIGVDMAIAAGIDPAVVRGALAGDDAAMGETASLAYRFAQASLARDMETADPLRDEIVHRWGEKALVAIGLSLVAARMYPTLKYALGHGKACSKVTVGGVAAPIAHLAIAA